MNFRIMISALITSALLITTAEAKEINAKSQAKFAPQSWTSANKQDIVSIQDSSDFNYSGGGITRAIQITAYAYLAGSQKLAGVYVQGCNKITHINPGTTILCYFNGTNKLIYLSADSDNNPNGAAGTFEIESR